MWGNLTHRYGWGGDGQPTGDIYRSYTNNRMNDVVYDAAGNFAANVVTYDVTGQQVSAGGMTHSYDGDGLRAKKTENGVGTYFLRSSVLGGQVIAELNGSATWMRGYVYLGSQLLAVQDSGVYWMHENPVTKSKRVTNSAGAIVSMIELDPWGADTNRSINSAFQPKKFTSYERDSNGTDEAMFRRHNRWMSRFDQPDPYDGSYDVSNPQSFNRYAYVQNDPVNFVDPSGLNLEAPEYEVIRIFTWDWPYGFSAEYGFSGGGGGSIQPPDIGGVSGGGGGINIAGGGGGTSDPVPKRKPPCAMSGSGDIGGELITPVFVGPKGGVQLDAAGVYPYYGVAAGTPAKGVSIMAGTKPVTPGVSVGFSLGFNRYAYTRNDPVNFTDPSGLDASTCGAECSVATIAGCHASTNPTLTTAATILAIRKASP